MSTLSESTIGFVGLGNMGGPMAANLARRHGALRVYDQAGTASRAPDGSVVCDSVAELSAQVDTVFMCLPDGRAGLSVAREILAAPRSRVRIVADHSTVGIAAAESLHRCFADGGIEYVDTPVSGGTAGAAKGTISTMYAGSAETLERLRQAFATMSKHVFHIGDTPGQGQAIKLLNNFLSAVAMAATSEAIAFGVGRGVSMRTILDVLNVSTGRNRTGCWAWPPW